MANKDSNYDSSSSDDCIFVNESVLSSDDELNKNLPACKLDTSTSSVSNDIIDTSLTAKPLITRTVAMNNDHKFNPKHLKNQIENICNMIQNDVLARGKTKVNFKINIKPVAKHKSKNILNVMKAKKIKSENKDTFYNQSSSSSRSKPENINYKGASNSKKDINEVVAIRPEIILNDNKFMIMNKIESKKCLENMNVDITPTKKSCTLINIPPNKNEVKNGDDTLLNRDLNTEIINTSIDVNNPTETKKCLQNTKLNMNVRSRKKIAQSPGKNKSKNECHENDDMALNENLTLIDITKDRKTKECVQNTELAKNKCIRKSISSNKNESKNDDDTVSSDNLNADIKNQTADKNVVHHDLTDPNLCYFSESFDQLLKDKFINVSQKNSVEFENKENTSNNCIEIWETYCESKQSDTNSFLELPDKTIDNTLTNNTADYFSSCLRSLPELNSSRNCSVVTEIPEKNDVVLDNEMPCVTCSNNRTSAQNKPIDSCAEKILRLHIRDILNSELIEKDPDVFLFQNVKYRFVRITGTISYLNRVSSSKVFIKIKDGTGEICCCFEDFPDRLSNRCTIANHLKEHSDKTVYSKKQLLAMGEKNDIIKIERYMQKTSPEDNPFLNSLTKIMLGKMLKYQPPINKDLKFGDFLTISGKIVDLNERLIYVWHIKKEDKIRFERQQDLNYSQISKHHQIYSKTDILKEKEYIYSNI